jgi:hypothetical protein
MVLRSVPPGSWSARIRYFWGSRIRIRFFFNYQIDAMKSCLRIFFAFWSPVYLTGLDENFLISNVVCTKVCLLTIPEKLIVSGYE